MGEADRVDDAAEQSEKRFNGRGGYSGVPKENWGN